ncbi:MAG: site-2 protease family protein [Patescibacteria group bacterium]
MIITELFQNPAYFLILALSVIYGITIHEFAHVYSAYLQGDNTGQANGRLTLNPIKHLDLFGTLAILFIGFGWGKPAPYNPYNLRYHKWGPALVSIAGPISNFASVLLFAVVLKLILVFSSLPLDNLLIVFLTILIYINLLLGIFNLIPIPPLDGSKILFTLIPIKNPNIMIFFERYGMFIVLLLLILGMGIFSMIIGYAFYYLVELFNMPEVFSVL